MPRTLRRNVTRNAEPVNDIDQPEEQESAPRGRRRSAASEEKPARGRRGGGDEEDKSPRVRGEVSKGWDGYEDQREEYGDYAPAFEKTIKEAGDESVPFKFVDDAPFAVYKQHWIERNGKKSFNCIAKKGKGCPICDELGDRPGTKVAFNVINLDDPENARVEVWTVSQKVADMIKAMTKEKRTSPINRDDLYFAVKRTGKKGGSVQTNIEAIKERDLAEDWDVEPLTEAQITEFYEKGWDEESIDYPTLKQLEDIVDEQM